MRPTAHLTSLAIMTALASGFSLSPARSPVGTNPSGMSVTTTAAAAASPAIRRRPAPRSPLSPPTAQAAALSVRGGGVKKQSKTEASAASLSAAAQSVGDNAGSGPASLIASVWGAGGVCYILLKAIMRVVPIALEPFTKAEGVVPLTPAQTAIYAATCAWFAYVEGYKGFQRKFSPLVVSRARTLAVGKSSFVHILLAPMYSMGLFHATKKRAIVSWSVTLGVAGIVAAVKRLPYPWRNIVDAGVVVGLTWGTISIILSFVKALATGKSPSDPALPEKKAD